jgi:hypothetical protein
MRYWIALELTVTPLMALLACLPFWRKGGIIFGNIVGTGIIFVWAIALMLREYAQVNRAVQACLDAGTTCWPEPSAFVRFAIYASIALAEVFALFWVSLSVEKRMRDRDYAPEWR